MSAREDGIFVPRRLVIILIIVSLCVNVFFLLMGILIGKDDIKFQNGATPTDLASQVIEEDPQPIKDDEVSLDDELSLFEETSKPTERRDPIDTAYLEASPSIEVQKPEPEPIKPEVTQNEVRRQPEVKKPQPKPEAAPPTISTSPKSGYYIQVLATSERVGANRFRDRLVQRGFPAVLVREGTFYKVRVGPYQQKAKADAEKARVNKAFKVKGWVIKK